MVFFSVVKKVRKMVIKMYVFFLKKKKISSFSWNRHPISSIGNIVYLNLVSPKTKHKLLKNKIDKYMPLGIILIRIIGLHHKENGALININLLDTRNICHIL